MLQLCQAPQLLTQGGQIQNIGWEGKPDRKCICFRAFEKSVCLQKNRVFAIALTIKGVCKHTRAFVNAL